MPSSNEKEKKRFQDIYGIPKDEIMAYLQKNEAGRETAYLLDALKSFPEVQKEYAKRNYGTYYPDQNLVGVNPALIANDEDMTNTLLHEMTHALDSAIGREYYNVAKLQRRRQTTPEQDQFLEGYLKLEPYKSQLVREKEEQQFGSYRTDQNELRAYGVADMSVPNSKKINPVSPHINATMATEAAILRDLVLRSLKSKK